MKNVDNCRYCGNTTNFVLKQNGPHVGLYCGVCGKWLKWIKQSKTANNEPVQLDMFDEIDKQLNNDLPWRN